MKLSRIAQGLLLKSSLSAAYAPGLELSTTLPPRSVEFLNDNTTILYPDAAWNSYNASDPTSDPRRTFVAIDGARTGPDDRLWLVDGGARRVSGSTKLVGANLSNDTVDRICHLDSIIASDSGIDDVRFNAGGDVASLSDTAGALLVLNLTTGSGVRVLVNDSSALAYFPMSYNGPSVPGYGAGGGGLSVGLDQIEVSPDGKYLYYQPCNGGLYRIETAYVDASLTNSTLANSLGAYATAFASTPSTGGSTIDADGNIYVSDTNLVAIWKVTPEGRATIFVQDDALVWTDLMWITPDKNLWLPASQMRPGNDGSMADGPNNIFTYPINAGPSPIDHA